MNKAGLLLYAAVIFSATSFAQAFESTVTYDKKKQQGLAIEYAYPAEAVENAIVEKLSKMGYKAKEEKGILNRDKGFLVYKNIYITEISSERADYMIKVERKGRKDNDEAILYMIILNGDKNVLTMMDAAGTGNAKSFLNNMVPEIDAANLELQIKAQEEVVVKAEKKLRDLKDDQASLEKKLQQNKTDQENTQKDIEFQKQTLGVLEGKRKPAN